MEPWVVALLVAAAFVAAFVDSIVGGGGIISLPALLAAGLPPHLALGTNKLAATGASFMATVRYTHAGVVSLRVVLPLIPLAGAGSLLGALAILEVQPRLVRALVVAVMAAMTLYVLLRPRFGTADRGYAASLLRRSFMVVAAGVVGFYDGFLGPGTGTFLIFAFVGILGLDFLRAAGQARVLNFASNAAALALFALRGAVDYAVGLPMMAAMLVGAYAGSHVGIRHGARWIRPLFVAILLGLMVRLLWALWDES